MCASGMYVCVHVCELCVCVRVCGWRGRYYQRTRQHSLFRDG